ncbi:hypothetical protein [Candidatus Orientia mediorientalis]|uniref:hypothetical protein n=1 Tax=Candidatus Orientia mediorientalis TaxID=911112 RepID=UPI000AEDEE2C|nr:hypothetical protein [Candidatus Orientia mediorientalis]
MLVTQNVCYTKDNVDVLNLRLDDKSQKMEALLETKKYILNNLSHEIKSPYL